MDAVAPKTYVPALRHPDTRKHASINDLPVELFQLIVYFDASDDWSSWVSKRWALLIESCPYLWATVRFDRDLQNMRRWFKKSKNAPLSIHADICDTKDHPLYGECVSLVTEKVHRWRTASFDECFPDFMKRINNAHHTLQLENLSIHRSEILADCKLFNPPSFRLRDLRLSEVTIPADFAGLVGLEVLHLRGVTEVQDIGGSIPITTARVRQALKDCPNLAGLCLRGPFTVSKEAVKEGVSVGPVVLKKLQTIRMQAEPGQSGPLLSLIDAENHSSLKLNLKGRREKPQDWAWPAYVRGLRQAESLRICIRGTYGNTIKIESTGGPGTLDILYRDETPIPNAVQESAYSAIEAILTAAEKDSPLTATIQLLFDEPSVPRKDCDGRGYPAWLRLLKFLQEPIVDPSSGEKRWRLPRLRSVAVMTRPDTKWLYGYLKRFVHTREIAYNCQAADNVTEILQLYWVKPPSNIFSEVMGYEEEMPAIAM
ncbi:hypothetical protein FRC05_005154 [Tulasnella sp. 425]|nr:hypothetical protein FRC05_005154 [Tulasnella sp. 425]